MAVTVHVGAHKTASTHLQQTLRALIAPMQRAGLLYLDIRHLRRWGQRLDDSLADRPGAGRLRSRWRAYLDLAADTWPQMLLSEENILGSVRRESLMDAARIYPQAGPRVDRLCAMLGRRPVQLFMAVREPLAFLGSAYSMQVEGGFVQDFAAYVGDFDPARPCWSDLARRLLAVQGVAGLTVWRYEDYRAVRSQIVGRLVPGALVRQAPDPQPALVGLSSAAHEEIRRRLRAGPPPDPAALARAAKSMFPRNTHPGRIEPLDPAAAARVREAYAADIESLRRLDRVTLLEPPPALVPPRRAS